MTSKKLAGRKELKQKLCVLEDKLKRAVADYDNLEKRVLLKREEYVTLARIEILDKLIGVLDDLERAETHLKDRGLSMAMNQLRAVLTSEGVEEVAAEGKAFDPERMDCVAITRGKKNRVMKVCQKGYLLKGIVIRPEKVEVGSGRRR